MKLLISLDKDSKLGLQLQIREKMVSAILSGALPVGEKIISSRKLSQQLKVARNTVVLAYNQLVDEGFLVSLERKGLFVNSAILEDHETALIANLNTRAKIKNSENKELSKKFWSEKIKIKTFNKANYSCPNDWYRHPYPFIDGMFDSSLYPVSQWQEASRLAFRKANSQQLSSNPMGDDYRLIEEIKTKILPRRGITAQNQEILITSGSQQALFLLVNLLCNTSTKVAMEEPGSYTLRRCLELTGCHIQSQLIDSNGLIIDDNLNTCHVIFVTPSHQHPTAVTMPLERRQQLIATSQTQQQLIIEDDSESERSYFENPKPALRSLDSHNHVIYVSAIPKAIAPGLELGFIVAAPELIKQARRLRYLMFGNNNQSLQRTAAFFLFLGYYDAFMIKLNTLFQQRWSALRDALNHYLPNSILTIPNQGGTAFWVKCPEYLSMKNLVTQAAKQGILIEPVKDYYAHKQNYKADHSQACFRMGVTSISENEIRPGVEKLAKLIRDFSAKQTKTLKNSQLKPLSEKQLFAKLAGATLLCKTVYGAPCEINIRADGKLSGQAGHDNEDTDNGHWWIEDGRWFRQWKSWSYAEQAGFFVTIDQQQINWFNQNGRLVDTAIIHFPEAGTSNQKLV